MKLQWSSMVVIVTLTAGSGVVFGQMGGNMAARNMAFPDPNAANANSAYSGAV